MGDTTAGLALLLIAGITNASFTLPMKYTRRWAWENTWLVWTIFALLILPPVASFLTVPNLRQVYAEVGPALVLIVAAFGAGWGVAQVLFGLAVDAIGIALTFSIVLGMSAAIGSIIPLIRLHPEKVFSNGGLGVMLGVALVLVGVVICAVAGRRRETAIGVAGAKDGSASHKRGLMFAIGSGLGAAMVNLGLAFGGPLLVSAQRMGADPVWAPNAAWLPVMLAGSIPNLAYCIYLLRKNKTASRYSEGGTGVYWVLAFIMAVFWFGSTSLYGIASGKLGSWGTILGWPLFMSLIVITASVLGILTGEWKNAGKKPLQIQLCGVAVLVLAVFVLSAASRWV
jgi:L-rhamnose-H+ transport protein